MTINIKKGRETAQTELPGVTGPSLCSVISINCIAILKIILSRTLKIDFINLIKRTEETAQTQLPGVTCPCRCSVLSIVFLNIIISILICLKINFINLINWTEETARKRQDGRDSANSAAGCNRSLSVQCAQYRLSQYHFKHSYLSQN